MDIDYYGEEWPESLLPDVRAVVSALETRYAGLARRAYLCPPREWEKSEDPRVKIRFFITNGGTTDWLLTISPRLRRQAMPPLNLFVLGAQAALKLGAQWERRSSPLLLAELGDCMSSRVEMVGQNAWLSASGVLLADSQEGMPTHPSDTRDAPELPAAHPNFSQHFSSPIYEDVVSEFAPFGSDEGYDVVFHWAGRREEIGSYSLDEILQADGIGGDCENNPEVAVITVASAFTMLRLAGSIDEAGRRRALRALDLLIENYDSPEELIVQRSDLVSWGQGSA
ncbi:hypothetical protein [Ornithinimicrobium cerasi]|uniref:Uncharacterized conserved protein YfeS, contains WGR domain n=1 Tax=Ornithinimicrobium cerasi TaxID=2248773 RepID=A0A285VJD7_9MICO|nr:hypothetical protein [Ornithinimicrobium cerasi]SOC54200.1 Uncharacterized conserved protein YfeS, contains WGR domain [Ornithinimicrobium cerasi]